MTGSRRLDEAAQLRKPQGYASSQVVWRASADAAAGTRIGTVVPFAGTTVDAAGYAVGLFGGRQHQKRAAEYQRRACIAYLRNNVLPKLEACR